MSLERALPARGAGPFSSRLALMGLLVLAGFMAAKSLGLDWESLWPGEGGMKLAREFMGRALSPALQYESAWQPESTTPILLKTLGAAGRTVLFAAAALALSLPLGLLLGFLSSQSAWNFRGQRTLPRMGLHSIPILARSVSAVLRSIHELLWALLFLAAMGLSTTAGIAAIALPYAGTFAKVFAELLDETDSAAADALRGAGASHLQVFFFGLLPSALPQLTAYTFYRFECALRSSAVLGFFGFPTLGIFIAASFENLYFGEVWTYLYALIILVTAADIWSAAMRRRFER